MTFSWIAVTIPLIKAKWSDGWAFHGLEYEKEEYVTIVFFQLISIKSDADADADVYSFKYFASPCSINSTGFRRYINGQI